MDEELRLLSCRKTGDFSDIAKLCCYDSLQNYYFFIKLIIFIT